MASKRLYDIIQAAVDFHLLNETGELSPWSSSDYQKAADKLNMKENCSKINRDYLYVILKNNRYNLLDSLKSKCGIEVAPEFIENVYESEFNEDDEIENETIIDEGDIFLNNYVHDIPIIID